MFDTDNVTAYTSAEFDDKVTSTVPYYCDFHHSAIDVVRALDKKIVTWLDTGCGAGALCVNAKKIFPNTEFILADPSLAMLKMAQEKLSTYENITYLQSDTQSLRYQDSFDVITAIQCHHYLERQARMRAIENCYSIRTVQSSKDPQ